MIVPPNATDKLQPLDVSFNKPMKDQIRKRFHTWYAKEEQKQLETAKVTEVKVDVTAAVIKAKSAGWFVSSWQSLCDRPEIVLNGFRKAGILDAIRAVTH